MANSVETGLGFDFVVVGALGEEMAAFEDFVDARQFMKETRGTHYIKRRSDGALLAYHHSKHPYGAGFCGARDEDGDFISKQPIAPPLRLDGNPEPIPSPSDLPPPLPVDPQSGVHAVIEPRPSQAPAAIDEDEVDQEAPTQRLPSVNIPAAAYREERVA
jgi:hypothetical protein